MKKVKDLILKIISFAEYIKDIAPLAFRAVLAFGFYQTATAKWSNIQGVAEWFGNDLGIPFPLLNAYMATSTEVLGVVLLILGLGTRFIAGPLIVIMFVAIKTVHWKNGFSCGDNGFEIPLYFLLMLGSLITTGAGRVSLDYLVRRRCATCCE